MRAVFDFKRSIFFPGLLLLASLNLTGCIGLAPTVSPLAAGSRSDTATAQTAPAAALATQGAPASLQTSPSSIAFGNVLAGVNNSQQLYVANSGSSSLSITQIAASGPGFGVSGFSLPLTLIAGQSASFAIDFDSTQFGAASGIATITSNAPGSPTTVSLSATVGPPIVQLSANPAAVSFGNSLVGAAASQDVALTNSGNSTVAVSSISAAGAGFSVGGASSITLEPSQTFTATVIFDPASIGPTTGSLTVTSNAPQLQIALSGTGAAASQHPVAVSWSPSPSVVVGYFVYRGVGPNPQLSRFSGELNTTTYTDSAVVGGQSYTYAVTAVDANNVESALSTTATVTIPPS
jgi:hypothetical protein